MFTFSDRPLRGWRLSAQQIYGNFSTIGVLGKKNMTPVTPA